jgi:Protein of unknown function (DUF2934)
VLEIPVFGVEVDIETRRKKQQALLVQLVERQVRSRAQKLYEDRGEGDGQDLRDWFQAESEVLENNVIAPLYRRLRTPEENSLTSSVEMIGEDFSARETVL